MKFRYFLSSYLIASTLSFSLNAVPVYVHDLKTLIETRDLSFGELLVYWEAATGEPKTLIEKALDEGDYRQPSTDFMAPDEFVSNLYDPVNAGYSQYMRLKDCVVGGERNPHFHAWFKDWFRHALENGPGYRAFFLAREAQDNARRALFEARHNNAAAPLVARYHELARRFIEAAENPDVTFEDVFDIMQDDPAHTPQRMREASEVEQGSLKNASLLAKKARELGKQCYLDLAGAYHRLAIAAAELLQRVGG